MRFRRVIELVVLAAVVSLDGTAQAQWERIQVDWTGENGIRQTTSRSGSAYPLQFYLTPSAERDFDNSLCLGCDMYGHRPTLQDFTVEASQREIGEYRGRKLVEIVLSFRIAPAMQQIYRKEAALEHSGADESPEAYERPVCLWKSIVMETSIGKYRELYFLIDSGTWIRPLSTARVLTVGGAQVLVNVDPFNFHAGGCTDGYWILEAAGPSLIDFTAVQKQVKKLVPSDAVALDTRCNALALDKLLVSSPVQKKNACHSCDYLGTAEVHFRLDGNQAIPVSSSFVPEETK
jgi:hypothetical protein